MKSCSCLPPGTVGSVPALSLPAPPPPPPLQPPHDPVVVAQSGVKKGRIVKRPTTARRKKSIVSEGAVESVRADAVRSEKAAAQSGSPRSCSMGIGDHSSNEVSGACRASCTTPGWDIYDFFAGPTGSQPNNAHSLRCLEVRDSPPTGANNHPFGQGVLQWLAPRSDNNGSGGDGDGTGGDGCKGGGGGGGDGNSNVGVPEPPLVSPTIGGRVSHPLLAQNGGNSAFHLRGSYDDRTQKDQNSTGTFPDQFNDHKPRDQNYYSATMPQQQSVALFPQTRQPGIGVDGKPNGHLPSPVQTAAVNGGLGAESPVAVALTSIEWNLIERIRFLGVDVKELLARMPRDRRQQQEAAELAAFLAMDTHNGQPEVNGSLSSNANSPFTGLDSAHSSPPAMNGGGGGGVGGSGGGCCSSGNVRTSCHLPRHPPSPSVNYPIRGGGHCGGDEGGGGAGGNSGEAPVPKEPGSPICKCGEACRCVPCADHPHNPAMVAHIKENVELMESPQQHHMYDASPHPAGAKWYDEDGTGDSGGAGEIEDLQNFVFAAYPYGSAAMECSNEGPGGGCKCGEGCMCVGCLTHGGHNGMPLGV